MNFTGFVSLGPLKFINKCKIQKNCIIARATGYAWLDQFTKPSTG